MEKRESWHPRGSCNLHMLIKLLFGSLARHVRAPSTPSVCTHHPLSLSVCLSIYGSTSFPSPPFVIFVIFRVGFSVFDSSFVWKVQNYSLATLTSSFCLSFSYNQTSSPLCTSSQCCPSLLSISTCSSYLSFPPIHFRFYSKLPFCAFLCLPSISLILILLMSLTMSNLLQFSPYPQILISSPFLFDKYAASL